MQQIFDAIFGNIFFLIAIIAGIFSFFKNRNKDQEQKGQVRKVPTPPITNPDPFTGKKPVYEAKKVAESMPIPTVSIEALRSERLEAFASQLQADAADKTSQVEKKVNKHLIMQKEKIAHQLKEFPARQQISRSLTHSGLINSVIMAEVLGKPRGLKPYRSIIDERKSR